LKTRKREDEENREKENERREHSKLSLKKSTNFPFVVLLHREKLFIKKQ